MNKRETECKPSCLEQTLQMLMGLSDFAFIDHVTTLYDANCPFHCRVHWFSK